MHGGMAQDDGDLAALDAIARRIDDAFELPLPDAPGFCFIGAKFHVVDPANPRRIWRFSAGAAGEDRQGAFRRCIGEAAETMAQFCFAAGGDLLPVAEMPTGLDLKEVEQFIDIAGGSASAGWVPSGRLGDGSPSSVPAALCFRDLANGSGYGLSLGCAAGPTRDKARLSALLELIERDAVALWWRGGNAAARFENDETVAAVNAMRGGVSQRTTWFLDLTTDIGVPVAAAVSADSRGGTVALGFAARMTMVAAALAALNELAQMELANHIVKLKVERAGRVSCAPAEVRQLERLSVLHAGMSSLSGADTPRVHERIPGVGDVETLDNVVALLTQRGIPVHCVDLTRADIAVPVVKVFAPLLQAEPAIAQTERLQRCQKTNGLAAGGVSPCEIV